MCVCVWQDPAYLCNIKSLHATFFTESSPQWPMYPQQDDKGNLFAVYYDQRKVLLSVADKMDRFWGMKVEI